MEKWKLYENEILHDKQRFEVSSLGRVKSFNQKEPIILKCYVNNGYSTFSIRKKDNKRTLCYVHKAVAEMFLPREENQEFVIHKDYDKLNNKLTNLAWATRLEMEEHGKRNPRHPINMDVRKYKNRRTHLDRVSNSKLTATEVIKIKKIINDPKRKTKIRIVARQFGVGVEQIYRIRNGESWGWLTEEYLKYGEDNLMKKKLQHENS